MNKDEAYKIVKRVADAFSSGDCRNLPSMKEIDEAAGVIAKIANVEKPDLYSGSKKIAVLTKKLADYLKELIPRAEANECRDILVAYSPDLDDKLPCRPPRLI